MALEYTAQPHSTQPVDVDRVQIYVRSTSYVLEQVPQKSPDSAILHSYKTLFRLILMCRADRPVIIFWDTIFLFSLYAVKTKC